MSIGLRRHTITTLVIIVISMSAHSQPITIGGIVRDTVTLYPLDSVRVEIVNTSNPLERYTVYTNGAGRWSYTFQSSGVGESGGLPQSIMLHQNYPNPFNPSTILTFRLHKAGLVRISVHGILGQVLDERSLMLAPGGYSVRWSSKGAAGVLFYTLESDGVRLTKKMLQLDGGDGDGLGDVTLTQGVAPLPSSGQPDLVDYTITVSKLGYEPDSVTVPLVNNNNVDFRLQTVHRRAFVIDLHNDVLELVVGGYQLGVRHTTNHSDLPRFRDGGVDAQMLSLWPSPTQFPNTAYERVLQMADSFSVQLARNPTTLAHTRTVAEIEQAVAAGKFAGILAVEGGHAIQEDLNKLVTFYQRGVRYMTITWNNSTSWATAAADPQAETRGLSDFGRQVIRTMDSLGIIIDVSHVGRRTILDILQVTTKPIVASHSGVRALRDHYRNLTDDQIISIAQRGGVIGVVFYPTFLSPTNTATIDTVIRHIDYIKNLVGIDYVALGSDFDGINTTPVGLEDVSRFPNLTMALLRHGYTPAEVRKLLGENYMRVFRAVCR
ncbi:MAG: dipeptidase [Bacteroidota bacterium]